MKIHFVAVLGVLGVVMLASGVARAGSPSKASNTTENKVYSVYRSVGENCVQTHISAKPSDIPLSATEAQCILDQVYEYRRALENEKVRRVLAELKKTGFRIQLIHLNESCTNIDDHPWLEDLALTAKLDKPASNVWIYPILAAKGRCNYVTAEKLIEQLGGNEAENRLVDELNKTVDYVTKAMQSTAVQSTPSAAQSDAKTVKTMKTKKDTAQEKVGSGDAGTPDVKLEKRDE